MPLLNYTTTIAAAKTLGEIQALLAKAKATRITLDYAGGAPSAIAFSADTQLGERCFVLPANVDAVLAALRRQRVQLRYQSREHAVRVAWRIVKDWLEAQLAIIESGMVSLDEVMLPYALLEDGRTVYAAFAERRLKMLRAPAEGGNVGS